MTTSQLSKDIAIKEILCCPDCFGSLSFSIGDLICNDCKRSYPVVDGIYSMLPSKSEDDRDLSDPLYQKFLTLYPEILKDYFYKKRGPSLIHDIPRKIIHIHSKKYLKDGSLLDYGCGYGIQFPYYDGLSNVVGVDINIHLLKTAKSRYPASFFIQGDCYHLPFKPGSFTNIISVYTLEHLFKLKQALKEVDRVLIKNGNFFVGIPCEELIGVNLGRKIFTQRHMHKKYGLNWSDIMKIEHCNRAADIIKLIKEVFDVVNSIYLPFFAIRSTRINIIILIFAKKRSSD